MSALEETLAQQMRALRVPEPVREYRFCRQHVGEGSGVRARLSDAGLKDWRFDFCWPDRWLACEVEGGAFVGGRHTRGVGFTQDCHKYHHAMRLGWMVYRCDATLIKSGKAAALLLLLLTGEAHSRWTVASDRTLVSWV